MRVLEAETDLDPARYARDRGRDPVESEPPTGQTAPVDLTAYAQLGRPNGQPEVTHGTA